MFSISPNIRRVSLPNNEQELVEDQNKHNYDLSNENYYDINGVIVHEAPVSKYKGEFIKLLEANRLEIIPFLNHHFQRSNDPNRYLNYVEVDLSQNSTLDAGIKNIIREWLKVKSGDSDTIVKLKPLVKNISDIFIDSDWEKYIDALNQTDPPLLDDKRRFIGKPKKHKGVICNWIRNLQDMHIVKNDISRQKIVVVLNEEIKNLNLGKEGKTLNNPSYTYEQEFEKQLHAICGLK